MAVGSPPTLEHEFVSDAYQDGDINADELKKEMDQLGVTDSKKEVEGKIDVNCAVVTCCLCRQRDVVFFFCFSQLLCFNLFVIFFRTCCPFLLVYRLSANKNFGVTHKQLCKV
jgi:hypothetical protein